MAQQGSHQRQRNGRHHDQRQAPGGKYPGQHHIHQAQPDDQAGTHVGEGITLVRRLALEGVAQVVALGQRRQHLGLQRLDHRGGVGHLGVEVGADLDGQTAIGVTQRLEALAVIQRHHLVQWHQAAIVHSHHQPRQGRQVLTLVLRQQHPHLDLVGTVLIGLHQHAIEGCPQLAPEFPGGQAQRLTIGVDRVDQLFAPPGHVVLGLQHPGQLSEAAGQ